MLKSSRGKKRKVERTIQSTWFVMAILGCFEWTCVAAANTGSQDSRSTSSWQVSVKVIAPKDQFRPLSTPNRKLLISRLAILLETTKPSPKTFRRRSHPRSRASTQRVGD